MSDSGTVLSVRVYGDPVAQGRPRARAFQVAGKTRVSVYDPNTSRDWKRTVQSQVIAARIGPPSENPLRVHLRFFLRRPKSLAKRVRQHIKRPDCDNLAKAVKDAMKGITYLDDSQVVVLLVTKEYGPEPGVDIQVSVAAPWESSDARTPPSE